MNFTSWASIAHLMSAKGGDYLLILSVGGTLFIFLPFLGDAICQAQTTVVSHILGSRKYEYLDKAFRSGSLLVLSTALILSIPLVIFPHLSFQLLFPSVVLDPFVIRIVLLGVWISFSFYTFGFVPISYILAFKDTKFSFFMGIFSWFNGYLLMYLLLSGLEMPASFFWIALSLMHGSNAFLYWWRMKIN